MSPSLILLALSFLQLLMFGSILVPLLIEEWVSQGKELTWTGSLIRITQRSDLWKGKYYHEIAHEYCDLINGGNYKPNDGTEAFCKAFETLYSVGKHYIFFSCFALLIWLGTTIGLYLMLIKGPSRCGSVWVIVLTPMIGILHGVGFAIWMANSRVSFMGSCDHLYDGDEPAKTCAEAGSKFALFALIFNICYAPVLVLVIAKKWYMSKEIRSRFAMRRIDVEMFRIETAQPVYSQEVRPTAVSTPVGFPCNSISTNEICTYGNIVTGYPVNQFSVCND